MALGRPAGVLAAGALMSLAVAACGGDSGGAGGGTTSAASRADATPFKVPASGCGSFASPEPDFPVVQQMTPEQRKALAGYTNFKGSTIQLLESAWKDWKPSHPAPYKVAISWGQLVSDFNVQAAQDMKKRLEADPDVSEVTLQTTGSNLDVAQQLQQYNSLVQQKPDIIVLETPSADSFIAPVAKAAAQGIPTVTLLSPVPSKYAVNVDGNTYQSAGWAASFVAQQLKGQGNVMRVYAIAGSVPDSSSKSVWDDVLSKCPGLKDVGAVYGGFSDSLAKSETLKFLATHPQKIDAALETAVMAPGVMRAFDQTGRPMPVVPDVGLSKGSLGYWNHTADYSDIGSTLPPLPAGEATAEVALKMLDGQGVKYNAIVGTQPLVDDTNLKDWAEPSWTLETPGAAPGTRDSFLPESFLDTFFTNPKPLDDQG
jgi:ribose transport system substrate-binding protein